MRIGLTPRSLGAHQSHEWFLIDTHTSFGMYLRIGGIKFLYKAGPSAYAI